MGTSTFFGIEENEANQVPKTFIFSFFLGEKTGKNPVTEGLNYRMANTECMQKMGNGESSGDVCKRGWGRNTVEFNNIFDQICYRFRHSRLQGLYLFLSVDLEEKIHYFI